jgi:hypothetical protein
VPVIGLVKTLRDSFHAEYGFVEIRHSSLILGIEREMPDFSRHGSSFGYNASPLEPGITNRPSCRQRL